ncbi:MAG TPA: hypothetical protein VFP15_00210, partial [Gemmatimonadaceae bacterium]|nr:hypothetical protein [Gemmatimonadaceae bacterium]
MRRRGHDRHRLHHLVRFHFVQVLDAHYLRGRHDLYDLLGLHGVLLRDVAHIGPSRHPRHALHRVPAREAIRLVRQRRAQEPINHLDHLPRAGELGANGHRGPVHLRPVLGALVQRREERVDRRVEVPDERRLAPRADEQVRPAIRHLGHATRVGGELLGREPAAHGG